MTFDRDAIWRSTGLLIACDRIEDTGIGSRLLRVEDLNPEVRTRNVVTRWQVFRIGAWLMWRALFAHAKQD